MELMPIQMKTDITVRDFEVKDLPVCWDISLDLWGWDIAEKIEDEMMDKFDTPSKFPPYFCVAETEGRIVGFSGCRRALVMSNAWEMIWNNVHFDFQRRGIGRLMIEYRLEQIKKKGGTIVFTMTKLPQLPGGSGFEIVSRIDGWYLMVNKLGSVDIT